jgi:hypothetical protein
VDFARVILRGDAGESQPLPFAEGRSRGKTNVGRWAGIPLPAGKEVEVLHYPPEQRYPGTVKIRLVGTMYEIWTFKEALE